MIEQVQIKLLETSTASDLSEKFQALFPRWTTVLATILATVLLMLVLGKLVYRPIKKMIQDRKNYIQNNINQAVKQNQDAVLDREQANNELTDARIQAEKILNVAKIHADSVKEKYLTNAKDEAKKIVADAHKDMAREKEIFAKESKRAIVEVALAAAAKVVEKEVDNNINRKIIEDFINNGE